MDSLIIVTEIEQGWINGGKKIVNNQCRKL